LERNIVFRNLTDLTILTPLAEQRRYRLDAEWIAMGRAVHSVVDRVRSLAGGPSQPSSSNRLMIANN